MPNLKQLTCHVEWSTSNLPLQEFQTSYADGFVETYIAVPAIPTPFSVHLRSRGYIAPGLAMFVYMDGEYQCNRNRTNLKIPDGTSMKKQTEVEFLVRQKEEITGDGSFRGKQWRFGTLNIASTSDGHAQHPAPQNAEYLGTIEVVVLRCYSSEAHIPVVSKKPHLKSPPLAQSSKPTIPKTSPPENSPPSSDEESSSSSGSEGVTGGLLDGGSDPRRSTSATYSSGRDGRWDTSTTNQGQSYRRGTPRNVSGPSSARVEGQQWGSNTSKQPILSQDWDTPEIDRPPYWKKVQNHYDRNDNNGKDRDRHHGNSRQSPAINIENQSNRSVSRGTPQGHPSAGSPAVVINVNHTPQQPIDWVQFGPSALGSDPQKGRASSNENIRIGSNHGEGKWDVVPPMPGAWEDTSNESAENPTSWDNDQHHDSSYWNEANYQPQHESLDNPGNNNNTNWDNSSLEATHNEPNPNANQDTEWEGSRQDAGNDGAWNSNDKYAAPEWVSYPNNNNQQDSGLGQAYTSNSSNHTQLHISQHPNHNQAQQDAYGATTTFSPAKPWQQPAEAPEGQNIGITQPQPQSYPAVNSNLWLPMDPRPKPHWSSWKQSSEAFSKPKPVTPPVQTAEPLYSVPLDIAQRSNMSHQVHVGQPAAYLHKRSSPKYMDSFESPYAVFVFKYRSKAILEQMLNTQLHEPEAEEKQRLLGLSKEELVEHVLKGKNSSGSENSSRTIQSRSSSDNTIKPDVYDPSNPIITTSAPPPYDPSTAPDNPNPNPTQQPPHSNNGGGGDHHNHNPNASDNASSNPSHHWDRNTLNPTAPLPSLPHPQHTQPYSPSAKISNWIESGTPRGGGGSAGSAGNYAGPNQHPNDGTNWINSNNNNNNNMNAATGTPRVGSGHSSSNINPNPNPQFLAPSVHNPNPSNNNYSVHQSAPPTQPISDWNKFGTAGAWLGPRAHSNPNSTHATQNPNTTTHTSNNNTYRLTPQAQPQSGSSSSRPWNVGGNGGNDGFGGGEERGEGGEGKW